MRLEDVIARYLPHGGVAVDLRPAEDRSPLSFSVDSGIEVRTEGTPGRLLVTTTEQLEPSPVRDRDVTVVAVTRAAAVLGQAPDILAWATAQDAQVVEIARLPAPLSVVVIRHGGPAEVPTTPGRGEPLPATEGTWKRLAGELLLERFRAAARDEQLRALQNDRRLLRKRVRRLRAGGAAPRDRRRFPLPRRGAAEQ